MKKILKQIELKGDKIFQDKKIVNDFLKIDNRILAPILINMLNFQETGKHEPCTFFALLLKIMKTDKNLISREVHHALKMRTAPYYYLNDLKRKMSGIVYC